MTDAQQALAQVREALAAGPTPGPWSVETVPTSCGVCHKVGPFPGKRPDDPPRHACLYADYPSAGNPADDELMANANFIAACHPEAIRELLAAHDALKAENEKLLTLERDVLSTLPGHYYMDPPDGGDVPVLEQLRRMAKDAARYRFLSCKGVPPYFHRCSRWRLEYWNGEWWDPLMKEELDAAIDAQIEQERSEQAKEPK